MIYAHVLENPNSLHFSANCFESERYPDISRSRQVKGGITFLMNNGNEHIFILQDVYKRWSVGRTHEIADKMSNNGFYDNFYISRFGRHLRLFRRDRKDIITIPIKYRKQK